MSIKDNELSLRLQAIYDLIKHGESVADIGTDHGYLPIALARHGKSPQIFAVDNKVGPLSQAQKMVDFYGVSDQVECTLVANHHAYHDVDVWVIAGMGYELIKSIIVEHFNTIKRLKKVIVQVNHQIIEFRKFCMSNQLEIIDEVLVKDGHFYPIIIIHYTTHPIVYSSKDLILGPYLQHQQHDTVHAYYTQKKEHTESLLKKVPAHHHVKREVLLDHLNHYNDVLKQ